MHDYIYSINHMSLMQSKFSIEKNELYEVIINLQ